MKKEAKEIFLTQGKKMGLSIGREELEAFDKYAKLLKERNKQFNLTAIVEDREIVLKHFLDSLTIFPMICNTKDKRLIDVGTGAGFPGIPLKIIKPDLNVILLDSLAKRVNFLNEVIENLDLKGIEAIHARAEDIGKDIKHREKYDFACARALAPMPVLLEYCLPLVKEGGVFIAMKGPKEEDSYKRALDLLGGREEEVSSFSLEDGQERIERVIYLFKKLKKTPTNFPRKAGIPSKNPL